MRGLIVTEEHRLALVNDIPMPSLGEYEALVRVECCAICNGTDNGIIRGTVPEASDYPLVLGHESVGIVVEKGLRVRHLREGDRVLRPYQKSGARYASAWGGFSAYAVVTDAASMIEDGLPAYNHCGLTQQPIDPRIDAPSASVMITLKETWAAMRRMRVQTGERLLILGSGPVGLCMAQIAPLFGAARVGVAGRNPLTLSAARRVGAETFDIRQPEELDRLAKLWGGGTDHFIDTVGSEDTLLLGQRLLAEDGMLEAYGLSTPAELRLPLAGKRNFGVRLVQWPTVPTEQEAHAPVQAAVLEGALRPQALITHVLSLECFEEGFSAIREKRAIKVILTMNDEEARV